MQFLVNIPSGRSPVIRGGGTRRRDVTHHLVVEWLGSSGKIPSQGILRSDNSALSGMGCALICEVCLGAREPPWKWPVMPLAVGKSAACECRQLDSRECASPQ